MWLQQDTLHISVKTLLPIKLYKNVGQQYKTQRCCSHQVRWQRGLEVEQHSDGRYLLQPFAAGLATVFLVLASIVETQPQCRQELLRQGAQGARHRLAEDHIPSQLQSGVWWWKDVEQFAESCSNTYALFH